MAFVDPNGPAAVYEHVAFWQKHSAYSIDVLNLWPGDGEFLFIPENVEISRYRFVMFHPTCTYDPPNIRDIDRYLPRKMRDFDGVKVLVKQDEQHRSTEWARIVSAMRIDLVLTCLPTNEIEKIYPRSVVGDHVQFMQTLTGYVTNRMLAFPHRAFAERRIDIGYRGSIQPIQFGRLGFEKQKIGRDVVRHTYRRERPVLDISSRWVDRLGGSHWANFLADSRIVLGAESGSNAFDLDGELLPLAEAYTKLARFSDPTEDSYYERACEMFLKDYENNVNYAQVAPRHFEAAAAGAIQLLYEGEYSSIFHPFKHFLPLKRDLSNLEDLVEQGLDPGFASEMNQRVLAEIVHDPKNSFSAFVSRFDETIETLLAQRSYPAMKSARKLKSQSHGVEKTGRRPKALLLVAQEPTLDPRVTWVSTSLQRDFDVCEVGTYRSDVVSSGPELEYLDKSWQRLRIQRNRHGSAWYEGVSSADDRCPAWAVFNRLAIASVMDTQAINEAFGPLVHTPSADRFKGLCDYFLNTNSALLEAASSLGAADVVVVADLEALPAGVAYASKFGSLLVYDAHEYWPYSAVHFESWETEFWASIENSLVSSVHICCTVSPQLAELMGNRYGKPFLVVPNCVPLEGTENVVPRYESSQSADRLPVSFLFQGGFAAGRGLDLLINSWSDLNLCGHLLLRGPEGAVKDSYIELAKSKNVLESTVFFPPPVNEAALIDAASKHDVGLVPYQPVVINNRYCSPNKLSQYMVAGIPIIASSSLDFVRSIIQQSKAGLLVDLTSKMEIAEAVRTLSVDPEQRRTLGMAGRSYYLSKYNWETVSGPLFSKIRNLVSERRPVGTQPFNFNWIDRGHMRHLASLSNTAMPSSIKAYHNDLTQDDSEALTDHLKALNERNSELHEWSTALNQRNSALHDRNALLEGLLNDLKTPKGILRHTYFFARSRIGRTFRK